MSESLGLEVVMEKARICDLVAAAGLLAERATARNTRGAILLAMMGDLLFNWQWAIGNCRDGRIFFRVVL